LITIFKFASFKAFLFEANTGSHIRKSKGKPNAGIVKNENFFEEEIKKYCIG
jgi:hypothetical protein